MAENELDLFVEAFETAMNRLGYPTELTFTRDELKEVLKLAIEIRTGMSREELENA